MAVSRIHGNTVEEYVRALRKNEEEVWNADLKRRIEELCGELEPLAGRLRGQPEKQQEFVKKLDELQASLASCDAAGEKGMRFMTFYEKSVQVIEDCRHFS